MLGIRSVGGHDGVGMNVVGSVGCLAANVDQWTLYQFVKCLFAKGCVYELAKLANSPARLTGEEIIRLENGTDTAK